MNPTCRLVLCLVILAQAASIFAGGDSYTHEVPVPDVSDVVEVPVGDDSESDHSHSHSHSHSHNTPSRGSSKLDSLPLPPVLNLLAPQTICDFLTYVQQVNQAYINNQVRMLNEIWSAYG